MGEGGGFSWCGVEGWGERAYSCNWIKIKIKKTKKNYSGWIVNQVLVVFSSWVSFHRKLCNKDGTLYVRKKKKRKPFNISCNTSFVVINSFSFFLSKWWSLCWVEHFNCDVCWCEPLCWIMFFIHFANLYVLTREFNPFIFKVITGK